MTLSAESSAQIIYLLLLEPVIKKPSPVNLPSPKISATTGRCCDNPTTSTRSAGGGGPSQPQDKEAVEYGEMCSGRASLQGAARVYRWRAGAVVGRGQ